VLETSPSRYFSSAINRDLHIGMEVVRIYAASGKREKQSPENKRIAVAMRLTKICMHYPRNQWTVFMVRQASDSRPFRFQTESGIRAGDQALKQCLITFGPAYRSAVSSLTCCDDFT
jgi:hypothetical protein